MKIDIVIYGPHGRSVLGRVDVPASAWVDGMPPHVWEQLSTGLFTEQLELVLHRKRVDAVAKHSLRLRDSGSDLQYLFACEHCGRDFRIVKKALQGRLMGNIIRPFNFSYISGRLGTCVRLHEEVKVS